MSKVEVNTVEPQCGTTLTLGGSGDTVALGSGASQTGFGRTGTVDWQTGSIKTTTFTAANGEGYFANTSAGAFTMNLPAGSAGDIVSVVDYTNTFSAYNLTVTPNGTEKIGGTNASATLNTEGQSVTFVYVDGVEGWKNIQDSTSNVIGETFVTATVSGACNTLTTAPDCANIKIATFVNPGTFCVSSISTTPADNTVGYMVVAGGGAGGAGVGGGGGAGGYREGRNVPIDNFTASPLVANTPSNAVTISSSPYPITVGGGGAGASCSTSGNNGDPSTFDTITSAGGGGGASYAGPSNQGVPGGSGGGGGYIFPGAPGPFPVPDSFKGTGNTPPTSPPQGSDGGKGFINYTPSGATTSAGGGGAGADGVTPGGNAAGNGGCGVASSITGASVTRAGGGGGGTTGVNAPASTGGVGGPGGGGPGGALPAGAGVAGLAQLGGGGGGGSDAPGVTGSNGGSGIVIIRYKFQ